jgi:hypothetical protein
MVPVVYGNYLAVNMAHSHLASPQASIVRQVQWGLKDKQIPVSTKSAKNETKYQELSAVSNSDASEFFAKSSVADPDPVHFHPKDPGSRMIFFRIPDPYHVLNSIRYIFKILP